MRSLRIPESEHHDRQDDLFERARVDGYDGVVLFGPLNIQYVSGMFHHPSERPVVLGLTHNQTKIVVPRLEKEHAERADFAIDEVDVYFEYPQGDPMQTVAKMCESLDIADGTIAVDSDGSPARNGYEGKALSDVISGEIGVEDYITQMREVKNECEIELIREASDWADLGHRLLQEKIEPGRYPAVVSREVNTEVTKTMLDTLGARYEMMDFTAPMQCFFTTGEVTCRPHSMNQVNRIQTGDNLVSIVVPNVGGYTAELERTMFVGEPSDGQREYFDIMRESQEVAINAIEPGVDYGYVEDAVTEYYQEQSVREYTQHHIGHSIGMEGHERPFLDTDYEGAIRAGEVFTIEPGIYVPDLGGFRHSDTVVVTEDGVETLTNYPRDIESLTIRTDD